jgi:hypothetical protein
VNGIKIDRKELTDGDKIMVDSGTPPELPSAAPPTAGRPAASGGRTDAMTGSIAYRHPVSYLPQQPPRFGDIASVGRRQRSRDQSTYTPTLLGRRRSLRSVRHRRKSTILRNLSGAVRPRPGLSGRRPHLQVPSTPPSNLMDSFGKSRSILQCNLCLRNSRPPPKSRDAVSERQVDVGGVTPRKVVTVLTDRRSRRPA